MEKKGCFFWNYSRWEKKARRNPRVPDFVCHIGFGKQEVGTNIKSKEAQGKEAAHFRATTNEEQVRRSYPSRGGL